MYSVVNGKTMMDSDYAQTYPRIFHRECVKAVDRAWLDKMHFISGTLPPVFTLDMLMAFTKEVKDQVSELMMHQFDMGLLSVDATMRDTDGLYLYFRLSLMYRSFGASQSDRIKFTLPIQGGGEYSSFTFISPNSR